MNLFQLGEQNHTLLFIGIGARDNRHHRLRLAGVIGKVRHIGGDIEIVAGFDDGVMLKPFAMPDVGDAAHRINRRLMGGMFVGFGARPRRHGKHLHMDSRRARRLG